MREKIKDAARALIISSGVRGFTMDDISHELGISKKTVYKFIASKNDLISSIIDEHINNDKEGTLKAIEMENNAAGKLKAALNCYYNYCVPLELLAELENHFPQEWRKVEELFDFKRELFRKLLIEGVEQGVFRQDINMDILMLMFDRTVRAMINYDFLAAHDAKSATANRMLDEAKNILFYGIIKNQQFESN